MRRERLQTRNYTFTLSAEIGCRADSECPSQTACINQQCVNPCSVADPCGINAQCQVLDTLPVRTMVCICITGYQGNAAVECTPGECQPLLVQELTLVVAVPTCPPGRGLVLNEHDKCVCPPGHYVDEDGNCVYCPVEFGFVLTGGKCVCDSSRGLVLNEDGRECVSPAGTVPSSW